MTKLSYITSFVALATLTFSQATTAYAQTSLADDELLSSTISGLKSGADSSAAWQSIDYDVTFSGNIPTKEQRSKTYPVETIFTNMPGSKGNVAFTCINEKVTVVVATESVDFEAFIRDQLKTRGMRTRKVPMFIDGTQQKLNDWTYLPNLKLLMPRKKSDRNKIYNAVLSQSAVTLDLDFRDAFTLHLPPADSTFAKFGASCGYGVNAK